MEKIKLLCLPLGISLFLMMGACKSDKNKNGIPAATDNPVPVLSEEVGTSVSATDVNVSGNIDGNTTVRLGFMVAGRISRIAVDEGQPVRKGQFVAGLEPTNYRYAKQLADIQVNQANDEYNRLKIMHDRNSLSDADFKKITYTVEQAQVQRNLQGKNLSDTRLVAPLSGVLLKKLAEPGEIVGSGTPILVISDISKVKVNAYIPENQLHLVKIGQMAKVTVDAVGQTFNGKVTEVAAAADVTTRAFTVKIEVPNPRAVIRPGMIAQINIPTAQVQSALTVPAQAVLQSPDGQSYIFVVDKQKGRAFTRNISVGDIFNDRIGVLSGLAAGETIVVGGQQKLSNGSKITLTK